jgi:hypothetical protein
MYCEHCGNELENGDKFCKKCGQPVIGVEKEKSNTKQLVIICVTIGIICVILLGVCIYSIAKKNSVQNKSDTEIGGKYSEEASVEYSSEFESEVLESETQEAETEIVFAGAYDTTTAIPELDEVGKQKFREAFQILPIDGLSWKDDYLADYVMLEIYRASDDDISVLEVPNVEEGVGITPVDLTYDSIDKGQEASYIRCSTEDMEKFLGEIYGKTYNIMQGQLRNVADEARNDNGYIYEWGYGWITSYCATAAADITKLEFIQDGGFLTTTTEYREESIYGDAITIYSVQCQWHYNPESPLLYTRDTYEIEERVLPLNNSNNAALQMTPDEIEQERLRIKAVIASGNVKQYILPVGTDGISWTRQLDYEDGELIFAYYYNSSNGDSDQRFYFKDGVMIRWVVGTAPNQIYYNISDDTLPDDWYAYEAECLNTSVE